MGTTKDENNFADRDPEELFCLKWNDFTDNVMATLADLRQEEDFFDVTLAIDGRQLRAHKLILSACSFFFRKLLRINPAPNPVIVLWDVSYEDMLNILDFMYNGEVRVKQANIQNFLAVAEKLKVRGLCQGDSSGQPSRTNSPQPPKSPSQSSGNPRKRQRRNSGSITEPEITVKDFAKNLKDESDTMSSTSHPQESLKREPDHMDDSDDNSINRNSFDDSKSNNQGNVNPGSFLGMAAASLMDPTAAKEFWRQFGLNPALMAAAAASGSGSSGIPRTPDFAGSSGGNGSNGMPSGGHGSPNPDGSGLRKPRSVYTSEQIHHLETFFRVNEYIDGERKRKLSQLTSIPEHQIKVWFQNRRQKKKREAEAAEQQIFQHSHQQQQSIMFPPIPTTTSVSAQNIGSIDPGELSS